MDFSKPASKEQITKTAESLQKNGMTVSVVKNGEEAKAKVLESLPQGGDVLTMTSVTLDTIGISQEINESGKYNSIRQKLNAMDREKDARKMQELGAAPEWTIGSVHAISEDGTVIVASNTGSQLPAYAYGAGHVIWVVGAQKLVKTMEEGMKRLYEHVLPLESERARKAYGVDASFVSKILIFHREINPSRIHIILVENETLGF
jgi:L-lactate utilization protein LutC